MICGVRERDVESIAAEDCRADERQGRGSRGGRKFYGHEELVQACSPACMSRRCAA